jgi:hypothetical protein
MKRNREKALTWWHKMSLEEKFYKTIEHNNLIVGDKTRHPNSLTGSEIESIYIKVNMDTPDLWDIQAAD